MNKSPQLPGKAAAGVSMAAKASHSRFAQSVVPRFAPWHILHSTFRNADDVRQGGFALVLVLGILMLLMVLAVGFISSAGTERAAASGFRASVSTRQLADTAVGLVQGQINMATTRGAAVAWASQPGMVRTFNNTNGNLVNAYKLYSATDMISSAVSLTADFPAATWAADTAIWTDLNSPVEVNGVKNFPILDPSSLGSAQAPEGFAINSAPGSTSYQTAPMPVRWLYVLRDGQVVAPNEATGKTATIPGATSASGANSIVGRIAFWTDDDTSKVNINTASEGTYWDTPRSNAIASTVTSPGDQYDVGYAEFTPAQYEFQRYSGHPATTSLSTVFPSLTKSQIYSMVPRVAGGGSNAGTSLASGALVPDTDRLYASVDELVFDKNRGDSGLSKTQLEQAKFFLTARSRAPETNLFNLPRIAMWPIFKLGATGTPSSSRTTAFDRLIAFCASTGEIETSSYHPFIFQRENAYSPTNDIGLGRNVELLSYLTYLTGQPTPGFGGNFSTKYGTDRDQILTETFDYIRSANLQDATLSDATKCYTNYTAPGSNALHWLTSGYGWVVPSQRGAGAAQTMGFGRNYTLSELALVLIANADGRGFLINSAKPTLAQCGGNAAVEASNNAKIDSNQAANSVLGGTPLKGEPFLDVGYTDGPASAAGNTLFDWADSNTNGRCDFEPWDDVNENGLYDALPAPGEAYQDLNGNGKYDQEPHEPLHDWGRDNNFNTVDADGSQGAAANASVRRGNGIYEPGEKYVQALMLPELFSPMQGMVAMAPDMQMTISGLETLQINGTPIFPSGITTSASFTNQGGVYEMVKTGGCPTYRFFGFAKGSPARGNLAGDSGTLYPFIGTPVRITVPANGNMVFTGGTITVSLYAGSSGAPVAGNLMQTFAIQFPSATFPSPDIVPGKVKGRGPSNVATADTAENWWVFSRAGAVAGKPGRLSMINDRVFAHNRDPDAGVGVYMPGAFLRPEYDTIRSMLATHGDYRLAAASQNVTGFVKHPFYDDTSRHVASTLAGVNSSIRQETLPGNDVGGKYISTVAGGYDLDSVPDIPTGAPQTPETTGDFDTGLASSVDGAYVNKPDEGDVVPGGTMTDYSTFPYYRIFASSMNTPTLSATFFSPNRQIPSSGMLGSLSTGVKANVPWKTLLFRPQTNHPSYSATIPDHLLMDLFWMPVVEPYAISDRFSTAGKINMNYQILPFTYIERSTGLRAVLKAERLAAIPVSDSQWYKGGGHKSDSRTFKSYRREIDVNNPANRTKRDTQIETLSQFSDKFALGQIFKSASEICDVQIVPTGESVANMASATGFWATNALTGDNLRERIYSTLYPRLTTKSNTFTVHFRVQALKQVPTTAAGTWTEGKDIVLGEYRGATSIERFIDANNPAIPDYAKDPNQIPTLDPLDKFYRWRVVENRQFAP